MRIIVCGSRDLTANDKPYVFEQLDKAHANVPITLLIEGGAKGADAIAEEWANTRGVAHVQFRIFDIEWRELGGKAGPLRNRHMAQQKPDYVVGFVNKPLEDSKGTASMFAVASDYNLKTHLFRVPVAKAEDESHAFAGSEL